MMIIQAAGGLGNQMQQYALYHKLKHLGRDVKMDLTWFEDPAMQENVLAKRSLELRLFEGLPIDACTRREKDALTGGDGAFGKLRRKLGGASVFTESRMYHPEILEMTEGYLTGYFACEKYYADVLEELRGLFVFPGETGENAQRNAALMREMSDPSAGSVSIHIRRGDYLDSENAGLLGGICTPQYYEGCVRCVKEKARSALKFYIFSDDPDYARSLHFGDSADENIVIDWNTGQNSFRDMQLMSCCRYNICANSTFSFWGARLNGRKDKVMLRPLVHKNTQPEDPALMHDLWKNWILIGRDGIIYEDV